MNEPIPEKKIGLGHGIAVSKEVYYSLSTSPDVRVCLKRKILNISLCVLCDLCGKLKTTEITEHTEGEKKVAHDVTS